MRIDQLATQSPATLQALKELLGVTQLDYQTAQLLHHSVMLGQHATSLEAALTEVADSVATAESSASLSQVHATTATGQAGLAAGSAAAAAASAATLADMESQLDGAVLAAQAAATAATAAQAAQGQAATTLQAAQAAATAAQASAQAAQEVTVLDRWQKLLLTAGPNSFLYDLRRTDTLFQNMNGSRVESSGQPLGMILDLMQGIRVSKNFVSNTAFSGTSAGWTLGTGWALGSKHLAKTAGTASNASTTFTGVVAGRMYRFRQTLRAVTGSFTTTINGSSPVVFPARTTSGVFEDYFVAPAGVTGLTIAASSTASGMMDDVALEEVYGNHAYQPTAPSRLEYWIDPLTSEPIAWVTNFHYTNSSHLLLMNAGSVGTLCIAAIDGPIVINAQLVTKMPNVPAVMMVFFDRILTDEEVQVVVDYFNTVVTDTSWDGYTRNGHIDFFGNGILSGVADQQMVDELNAMGAYIQWGTGDYWIAPGGWTVEKIRGGAEDYGAKVDNVVPPRTRIKMGIAPGAEDLLRAFSGMYWLGGYWADEMWLGGRANLLSGHRGDTHAYDNYGPYEAWWVPKFGLRYGNGASFAGNTSTSALIYSVDFRGQITADPGTKKFFGSYVNGSLSTEIDTSPARDTLIQLELTVKNYNGVIGGVSIGGEPYPNLKKLYLVRDTATSTTPVSVAPLLPAAPNLTELDVRQFNLATLDLTAYPELEYLSVAGFLFDPVIVQLHPDARFASLWFPGAYSSYSYSGWTDTSWRFRLKKNLGNSVNIGIGAGVGYTPAIQETALVQLCAYLETGDFVDEAGGDKKLYVLKSGVTPTTLAQEKIDWLTARGWSVL